MKLSLEFLLGRIQEFGGAPGTASYVRLQPGLIANIEESLVEGLFKSPEQGGDPCIEFYRANGDLLIRNSDGSEWVPGNSEPANRGSLRTSDPKPVQVSHGEAPEPEPEPKPAESITPARMGGGVPGQGLKDCKANVKNCEDLETLNDWAENEKRTSILSVIDDQIKKIKG